MERGRAQGRISVRRMLFSQAAQGSAAAAIFLAKNLLGYRDARRNKGLDGNPIAVAQGVDLSQLSIEELEQLQALTERAQAPREKS